VTAQMPATMIEAADTAQFIVTARIPGVVDGSEPGPANAASDTARTSETGRLAQTPEAVRRVRGRHAAPRPERTGTTPAGLARRSEGRHAATRPGGGVAQRFAVSVGAAAMVVVGLHPVVG
jgi:hypothetical protein